MSIAGCPTKRAMPRLIWRLIISTYLLCDPTSLFHPRAQAVAGHSGSSCTVGSNNTVLPTSHHSVPRTCLTTPYRQRYGSSSPSNKCVLAGRPPKATRWHGSRCDPCEPGQHSKTAVYDSADVHFLPVCFFCSSSCFVFFLPVADMY